MVTAAYTVPKAGREERQRLARERLLRLSRLMDAAIEVPILRTRVGLDAILGVVPVAGDLLSAAIGLYLVAQARELGASRWLQARMVGNLLADAALGAVPVAGDIADVYFKAHLRNLRFAAEGTRRAVHRRAGLGPTPLTRQRGRSRDGMRYSQMASPTPITASATLSHTGLTKNTIDVPSVSDISATAVSFVLYGMLR